MSEEAWQPIETLKMHFGEVLGWADGCGYSVIRSFSDGHIETSDGFNAGWIRFWMPLPASPTPKEPHA